MVFVNLSFADLTGAQFENVDMVDANLRFADLTDADFDESNLRGAKISGAIWDNTTCPDGTNSDDNGDEGFTCDEHWRG